MSLRRSRVAALALCLAALGLCSSAGASEPADAVVRPPAVAGKFYPADKGKLEAAIKAYLAEAVPVGGERPIGILAPHAGYLFSGQIAADAWAQAAGEDVDLVVILGTNHTVAPFDSVSVFQGRGYGTPLGVATVDQEVAKRLLTSGFTYRPEAHMNEHSEEVQVPFVQVLFPKAKIVTAVVGRPDLGLALRFGGALAKAVRDRKVLLVASSDLSHYPPYEEAGAADRATLTAVASLDPKALAEAVARTEAAQRPGLATCACGEGAIMAVMAASRALGATHGVVLSYANSGDTAVGDRDRVVGYGAVAFTGGAGGPDTKALTPLPPGKVGDLTDADKAYLLKLARTTIERFLATDTLPFPRPAAPELRARQGAFVTLTKGGDLRGCIGHMAEDTPLCQVVSRMALAAAFEDARFKPVQPVEVPSLEVEVSVLTPLAPVEGVGFIAVGRDGVVIRKGGRSAVFLPQVAPEQGWSREEMLDHLCEKAGLPADCWRSGCQFLTFRAIVFGEKKGSGERRAGSGKK